MIENNGLICMEYLDLSNPDGKTPVGAAAAAAGVKAPTDTPAKDAAKPAGKIIMVEVPSKIKEVDRRCSKASS